MVILSAKMDEKFQVAGVTVCTMGGRLRGCGWDLCYGLCLRIRIHTLGIVTLRTSSEDLSIILQMAHVRALRVDSKALDVNFEGPICGGKGVPHPGRGHIFAPSEVSFVTVLEHFCTFKVLEWRDFHFFYEHDARIVANGSFSSSECRF